MDQGHHSWYPVKLKLGLIDKLLLEHVGLPQVLDLAVHVVNFLCWMSQGVILSHFYYEHFFTDKLLLEHVGLPHVLDFAVHLVNFLG